MPYLTRPLFASVVFAALAGQACAADLPSKNRAPAPPSHAQDYEWSGFYTGATADYVASFKGTGDISQSPASMLNPRGLGYQGTLYGGYNVQMGSLVVGPEMDISFGKVSDNRNFTDTSGTGSVNFSQQVTGSFRARFGYAFNNMLVFATSGIVITKAKLGAGIATTTYTDSVSASQTYMGFAAGGGLEYGITRNLIARTEYRFSQYEKSNDGNKFGIKSHEARAGLAYKF